MNRRGVVSISEENPSLAKTAGKTMARKAAVGLLTTPLGWITILTGFVIILILALVIAAGHQAIAAPCFATVSGGTPTALAADQIPADYLQAYRAAEQAKGVPWNVLAGIGKVESNHGRSTLPGVHSGSNSAGAAGPMQIGIGGAAGNTWGGTPRHRVADHSGGYAADGDGDGWEDVYDPADAIFGAANYLRANGAPANLHKAIFAYNHLESYVAQVMNYARAYANGNFAVGPSASKAVCPPAGSGNLPSGNAQDLAKAILSNPKIVTDGRLVYYDIHQQATGGMPSNGVPLKASLLAVLLYIGQSFQVHVSALESGGAGHHIGSAHYDGRAMDINIINGAHTTGRDANAVALLKLVLPVLPKGSGVGQLGCGQSVSMPAGIRQFTDSCDHIHIQVP